MQSCNIFSLSATLFCENIALYIRFNSQFNLVTIPCGVYCRHTQHWHPPFDVSVTHTHCFYLITCANIWTFVNFNSNLVSLSLSLLLYDISKSLDVLSTLFSLQYLHTPHESSYEFHLLKYISHSHSCVQIVGYLNTLSPLSTLHSILLSIAPPLSLSCVFVHLLHTYINPTRNTHWTSILTNYSTFAIY